MVGYSLRYVFGRITDKTRRYWPMTIAGYILDMIAVLALVGEHGWIAACCLLLGIALWGIGMGAQESILKAAVAGMVPKACRATGYGIFEGMFGVFWFLGSWLLGVLYGRSIPAMIPVSVIAQPAAIPLYLGSASFKCRQE